MTQIFIPVSAKSASSADRERQRGQPAARNRREEGDDFLRTGPAYQQLETARTAVLTAPGAAGSGRLAGRLQRRLDLIGVGLSVKPVLEDSLPPAHVGSPAAGSELRRNGRDQRHRLGLGAAQGGPQVVERRVDRLNHSVVGLNVAREIGLLVASD